MHLQIGTLEIFGITEIERFEIPLSFMFPQMVPLLAARDEKTIDPQILSNGQVQLTIRSWLLRQDNRVILIDGCVGNNKDRPLWPGWHQRTDQKWLKQLRSLGVRPEDVDIVMCTHLHADHVGWNTKLENGRWVPTFPNARYLTGRHEYEHWLADSVEGDKHGSFKDSVAPIVDAGQMTLLDDGSEIAHGLSVELAPGHTPGQLMVCKNNTVDGAVFCGDVIHSPLQLEFPQISSAVCNDPALAAETRISLLSKLADNGHYLLPGHFADPGWCRIGFHGQTFRKMPD
ncbi:MAG: MBL fold metallo-hydrolase [Alphaproteobacteria bacterium]|nr:MBL fold metallo-hydrolase [Alphaproteobacteria bacterium]